MRVLSLFVTLVIIIATLLVVSAAFIVSVAAGDSAAVAVHDEATIRCKVCERAISYVWDQGDDLRKHCKSAERNDHRCDHSNIHDFGIEEMVQHVCKKLPKTHQALEASEFDLILHEDPNHPQEVSDLIYNTCVKWVHHEHGLENVALYLYANLDSGKHRHTILHNLQHRFCKNACNPHYKQSRKIESDHEDGRAGNSLRHHREFNDNSDL